MNARLNILVKNENLFEYSPLCVSLFNIIYPNILKDVSLILL
jgi:hypothetical protein